MIVYIGSTGTLHISFSDPVSFSPDPNPALEKEIEIEFLQPKRTVKTCIFTVE